jgi:hypothetical protein
MKIEQTECSETLAYKIQTPGNYPEENKQHSESGESLKPEVRDVPYIALLMWGPTCKVSI